MVVSIGFVSPLNNSSVLYKDPLLLLFSPVTEILPLMYEIFQTL